MRFVNLLWSRLVPLFATILIAAYTDRVSAIPTFDEVKAAHQPSDSLLLDRHGEIIHRLRTDASLRRGQWVALPEVSAALRTALVLSEDKRFYEHSGVDWQAVSAAAWGNLWNRKTRGASTLTMQLAGLLDDDWRASSGGRSVVQKLGQTVAAQTLDRRWRKDQILEAYLNRVPFRGEIIGIDALSQTLFDKAPHGLDAREAALAAALLRAPNAAAPAVARRACGVLREMAAAGEKTDCEALELLAASALQRHAFAPSAGIAPHLAQRLLAQPPSSAQAAAGSRQPGAAVTVSRSIRSTLRADLQRFAIATLQRHLRELHGRWVQDGAVVVQDNASGEVLAWVGSSGVLSLAAEFDGVTALRQPGSTLKPFLYAQAIGQQRLTAASLIEDSAAQIATGSGLYIPQNYDHHFLGWVSVRSALAASLNVPAVRTLVMVSPQAFARQLKALGLPLKESGDYYGYSLALGSAEVSLLSLTNAYRALANGGQLTEPLLRLPDARWQRERAGLAPTPVLDPRAAFIVADILADPQARARTFGLDSVLATRFWSAVKTGTSKDMRDNWAIGFSQRYSVGVWVGNASGAPMHGVSGASGAAPVWADLMGYLHRNQPSRAPTAPAGLVQRQIDFGTDTAAARSATADAEASSAAQQPEASRREWFIKGSEQTNFAINSIATHADQIRTISKKTSESRAIGPVPTQTGINARITDPTDGTILALDPDIPPRQQRLLLRSNSAVGRWLIDGKPQGQGRQLAWLPQPGKHRIELRDAQGQLLDQVALEVRGASLRTAASTTRSRP